MAQSSTPTPLRSPALRGAVAMGALADLLLRTEGRPGLNVALWAATGVVLLALLLGRRDEPASRESQLCVMAALGFAATLAWRDAEALAGFALLAAALLLALAAGRTTAAWVSRAMPGDAALAAARLAVLGALGPIGWGRGEPDQAPAGWLRPVGTLLRGTALALPPLALLGALLMNADPVFARLVQDAARVDLEQVLAHLLFTALVAWGTAGWLRAVLVGDEALMARVRLPRPRLRAADVTVALSLLNLLFLAFVLVQLRYLFGGADVVQLTAGLSYAEYARRGFFELVACAALVVPILLLADWAAAPPTPRSRDLLRGAMLLLVLLLLGVLASAAYRMRLYQAAYGLTEARLYASVAIAWLTAVLAWLVLTVLRGRRERFLGGAVVGGLACLAALVALDPHARIAQVNVARAAAGLEVDGDYLKTLGADAVPALLEGLDALPEAPRCEVARHIEARWRGERPGGWRTWNLADWRARRLVAGRGPLVPEGCPPPPAS
jgi:hypothetical protein